MAKKTSPQSQGVVTAPPAKPEAAPEAAGDEPVMMVLRAGPNASGGTFAMRISDEIRLELPRDRNVEVPPTLEYEVVCKERGPNFGKRSKRTVDVGSLLAKALRFGFVDWVNRPPPPPRQPRDAR